MNPSKTHVLSFPSTPPLLFPSFGWIPAARGSLYVRSPFPRPCHSSHHLRHLIISNWIEAAVAFGGGYIRSPQQRRAGTLYAVLGIILSRGLGIVQGSMEVSRGSFVRHRRIPVS